jgi:MFS family permease
MHFRFNRITKLYLLSTLLYGFSFSVWELFFNLYVLSRGLNNDKLGLIRSANPLSALVLGFTLGLLSDCIGHRVSMIIGLVVCFLGMFFQAQPLYLIVIFFFRLVQTAVSSLRDIGRQAGQSIGLFILRFVQTRFCFSHLFITTILCYITAIGLTWAYFRPYVKGKAHAI